MKSIFKSKTFWIAVSQSVLGIVVAFSTQYPDVGLLIMAKSALDIIIRLVTVEPVR